MTTTTNPGNYVDFDEYVGLKLEKTRSTIRTTDLLTAATGVVAMVLGYLLVFVLMDQWVVRDGFSSVWRWLLLSTLVISTITWLVWKIGIPSFQTVNSLFAAQEIEKADPGLKSNLLNLIDLKRTGRAVNPAILKALERRAAVQLQEIDVTHAIDHRPLMRTSYLLLTVIVLFSLYALISPKKISNSLWRGILPAANVPLATRTEILAVKPGNVSIPAHTPAVDIQVDLGGEIPHQVWLLYSTADGKFQRQPVEMRVEAAGQTRFQGKLLAENSQGLMQDLTYSIRAGDAESEQFKVTVEQPPSAQIESIRIEFPPYMKLSPVEQATNGQIDAWEGAKVSLTAKTNMPVRSGLIRFLDDPQKGPTGEESAMSVTSNGAELQAAWTLALRTDGSFPKYYQIDCRTEDGRRDTSPTNYGLTIRPDLPPEVELLQPGHDLDAPKNSIIPLLIQARDPDFELGYLYLNVEKGGQRVIHEQLSEGRQQKLLLKQELSLPALHLAAGEEIEVWIEAYDNKKPRPNTKNTPKIKIRVLDSVSKQEAEQQFAEQDSIREDKLAAAEQDENHESSPMAPPSKQDSQPRDPQKEPQPNEVASKQEQATEASESNEGTNGNTPGKSAEKNSRQAAVNSEETGQEMQQKAKSNADKNSNEPTKDTKNKDESQAPLQSDGSQDDEALKRIHEKLNQDRKPPAGKPSETNPTDPEQQQDAEQQPDAEKKPMPNGGDGDADANTVKEKTEKQEEEQRDPTNTPEQSAGNPETGRDKPQPQPKPTPKSEPTKNGSRTERPQPSEDPADAPASDDESQPKGPKPTDSDNPQDSAEAKPGEQSGQGEDPQQEKSNSKAPGKTEAEDSGQETPAADSNEKISKKKSAPPGTKPANHTNQPVAEPESTADQPETGAEPAADAPDGVKKNADGTEKGIAKPDRDPKSKPPRTNADNVRRDPSQKPETRPGDPLAADQESEKPGKPAKKPATSKPNPAQKKSANQDSAQDSSSNPEQAMKEPEAKKPAPKGPSKIEKPNKTEKSTEEAETDTDTSPSDGTDSKPEQSTNSPQSKVKTKAPQNSTDENSESGLADSDPEQPSQSESERDQPANSDAESSKPDKSGRGNKRTGEKSASKPDGSNPGEKSSPEKKTENKKPESDSAKNQPSGSEKKPGKGPSEQKTPGEKSESGEGKGEGEGKNPGEGGSTAKPADSADSPKPGKPGGSTMSGGGIDGDGKGAATEGGESPTVAPGEEANMEYNRQATELILQKLNQQLERGEVDAELLEQLGWTQQEMKQFADRIAKHLQESKKADEAPESKARQLQFQELLKNLDLQKSGTQRAGEKEPKRGVSQIEAKRTPIPPVYRSAYEKFTRDQARLKKNAAKN